MKRCLEEDPLNIYFQVILGAEMLACGRSSDAEEVLNRALRLDPNFWLAYVWRSMCRLGQGRLAEACGDAERAYLSAPWNLAVLGVHAGFLALNGNQMAADELIGQLGDGAALGEHRSPET